MNNLERTRSKLGRVQLQEGSKEDVSLRWWWWGGSATWTWHLEGHHDLNGDRSQAQTLVGRARGSRRSGGSQGGQGFGCLGEREGERRNGT